jgi:hypothetical protein
MLLYTVWVEGPCCSLWMSDPCHFVSGINFLMFIVPEYPHCITLIVCYRCSICFWHCHYTDHKYNWKTYKNNENYCCTLYSKLPGLYLEVISLKLNGAVSVLSEVVCSVLQSLQTKARIVPRQSSYHSVLYILSYWMYF